MAAESPTGEHGINPAEFTKSADGRYQFTDQQREQLVRLGNPDRFTALGVIDANTKEVAELSDLFLQRTDIPTPLEWDRVRDLRATVASARDGNTQPLIDKFLNDYLLTLEPSPLNEIPQYKEKMTAIAQRALDAAAALAVPKPDIQAGSPAYPESKMNEKLAAILGGSDLTYRYRGWANYRGELNPADLPEGIEAVQLEPLMAGGADRFLVYDKSRENVQIIEWNKAIPGEDPEATLKRLESEGFQLIDSNIARGVFARLEKPAETK